MPNPIPSDFTVSTSLLNGASFFLQYAVLIDKSIVSIKLDIYLLLCDWSYYLMVNVQDKEIIQKILMFMTITVRNIFLFLKIALESWDIPIGGEYLV